jgi:hypothetical protein
MAEPKEKDKEEIKKPEKPKEKELSDKDLEKAAGGRLR